MRASSGLLALAAALVVTAGGCSGSRAPAAVGSSATATGAGRTSASSTGSGWLAFQDTAYRIRLVRPDGSAEHALDMVTSGPEDNPDWSPDGKRLTFVGSGGDAAGNPGLWVINADGTGLTRLVPCSYPCLYLDDPAWSPDGSTIMYSRLEPDARVGGRLESVTVNSRATRTVLAAKPGEFFSGVRYAPDGKAVVLERVRASAASYDDVTRVTLARLDLTTKGAALQPLGDPARWPETPDWSPEGDLIVYAAYPSVGARTKDLHLSHPDGTGLRRLTTLADRGGEALHPDFSNDGSSVVFAGSDGGKDSFMTVDLATGKVAPALTTGSLYGHHPRSQPVH